MSNPETVAVLDFGTNTIKLTVARIHNQRIQEMLSAANVVRIGKAIDPETGNIATEAIDRALVALNQFEDLGRAHGATRFAGVATEAFRIAANGPELLDRIGNETEWRLWIISGNEEARLTFLGLRDQLPDAGFGVIADIGGGSTEVVIAENREWIAAESLRVGSGLLTDRYLEHDPPLSAEIERAHAHAEIAVQALSLPPVEVVSQLLLSGGTGQFLDALSGVEWKRPLSRATLPALNGVLTQRTSSIVADLIQVPQERARVLPGGLQVALAVTSYLSPDAVRAVPSGIRIGILQEMLAGNWD